MGSFTGNAELDFGSSSHVVLDDGNHGSNQSLDGCFDTSDVPCIPFRRSGFDIRRIYFSYDAESDVMHVGVDCYGICGDTDGDHEPDNASLAWKALNGKDTPSLASPEFFHLVIDASSAGQRSRNSSLSVSAVFGTNTTGTGGYTSFGAYYPTTTLTLSPGPIIDVVGQLRATQFHQFPADNLTMPSVYGLVDPAARLAEGKNSSYGDLEFSIERFSAIPGLAWTNSTLAFRVVAFFGSTENSPYPTIDAVPGQINAALAEGGAFIAMDCPSGVDPFGTCCAADLRDLCGVCRGNNSNLDPCGVCRINAGAIPTSACPAAASSQFAVLPDIGSNVPYDSISNASMALVDINNDRILDIVVGLPALNLVLVKFMSASGAVVSNVTIYNPYPYATANDSFGFSVVSVGDINNDGVTDLVVGAPGASSDGLAWVFLMTASGIPSASRKITPPSDLQSAVHESTEQCHPSSPAPASEPAPASPAPVAAAPTPAPVVSRRDVYAEPGAPDAIPTVAAPECVHSPSPAGSDHGSRFGSTILWLGRNFVLIGAPGAAGGDTSTSYLQIGAFLLSALTTDGNTIGSILLSTPIVADLAVKVGVDPTQIAFAQIGQDAEVAVSGTSQFTLASTVSWTMNSGISLSSLIFLQVRADGTVPAINSIPLPSSPIALPEYPESPAFNSSILPPNLLPFQSNYTFTLVGAGDLNSDGRPDVVLSIPTNKPEYPFLIVACMVDATGTSVTQTQLIGDNGVGHSPISLPYGYQFGVLSSLIWTPSTVLGMTPYSGSPVLVIAAVGVDSPVSLFAMALWGSRTTTAPIVPTSTPVAAPVASTTPTAPPLGLSPVLITAPTPTYPLPPHTPTDAIALTLQNNAPIMRISSNKNYKVWTQLQFSRIIERSVTTNRPVKTLLFPSRWTTDFSSDGSITTFTGRMITTDGEPTTVDVQVQIYTPTTDSTIVFSPSTYVGAHVNTVKYSLLIRGWVFSQVKTVLDIVNTIGFNEPIISVTSSSDPGNTFKTTKFTMQTPSCKTTMSVPTFALVDGILSNIPVPTFNQTSGQLILTVPPFFDTLYYDPDVAIVSSATPTDNIDPPNGRHNKSLLYIIIPCAIGVVIVGVLLVLLATCLCQQRRAEQRWKDAGAV